MAPFWHNAASINTPATRSTIVSYGFRIAGDRAGKFASCFRGPGACPEEIHEAQLFLGVLQQRRPVVTWALLGALLVVFGLEHLWGGSSTATLVRMGAVVEVRRYPGMPHGINQEEVDAVRKLLEPIAAARR